MTTCKCCECLTGKDPNCVLAVGSSIIGLVLVCAYRGFFWSGYWYERSASIWLALSTAILFAAAVATIKHIKKCLKDCLEPKEGTLNEFEDTSARIPQELPMKGEPIEDDDVEQGPPDGGEDEAALHRINKGRRRIETADREKNGNHRTKRDGERTSNKPTQLEEDEARGDKPAEEGRQRDD